MQNKLMKKWGPVVLSSAMLLSLASCGSDDDDDDDAPVTPPQQQQELDDGIYRANLSTLNPSAINATTGTALIEVAGEDISVYIDVNGAPRSIAHIQHIHTGTACPTTAADTNGDSFVDVVEGVPAYGPILVNLDGNLNSFSAGGTMFPMSDADGKYTYVERASFTNMIEDLRMEDTDPADAFAKLSPDQNINLPTRHIVVHGVPASANLPATVQSLGDIPAEVTLPIACGTISRVGAEEEATLRQSIQSARTSSRMGSTASRNRSSNASGSDPVHSH